MPYRFDVTDDEKWLKYLETHGYCVIADAVSSEGVEKAKSLLWKDISKLWGGTEREDPSTWKDPPFKSYTGIIPELAQSAGAWSIRGEPAIRKAYSKIWKTEELIVSMDCVIAWRPWWTNERWTRPTTENMHLDQNPFDKPSLETVQGMVPLIDVSKEVGGLCVCPGSHTAKSHEILKKKYPHMKMKGDWCPLNSGCECAKDSILLLAKAGDLLLWDSRTIHGGKVGLGQRKEKSMKTLARLAVTVSMVAKSRASKKVLQLRRRGFRKGHTFNHTPHELGTSTGTVHGRPIPDFMPPELTKAQRELLG